jgi:hypothetical protein
VCPLPSTGSVSFGPAAWRAAHDIDRQQREQSHELAKSVLATVLIGVGRALLDERRDIREDWHAIFAPLIAHGVPVAAAAAAAKEEAREVGADPAPAVTTGTPGVPASGAKCAICLERPIDCVLLECGHQATCVTCAQGIRPACPICRAPISRVVRTFVA